MSDEIKLPSAAEIQEAIDELKMKIANLKSEIEVLREGLRGAEQFRLHTEHEIEDLKAQLSARQRTQTNHPADAGTQNQKS
jgi:uncharacterized small protein (DUF1192 family)